MNDVGVRYKVAKDLEEDRFAVVPQKEEDHLFYMPKDSGLTQREVWV